MKTQTKDYYMILRISENASEAEIKKSFRKLAMELHPDRNPDAPDCEDKFKDVTEAYGVLIDPVKRKEYDRHWAGLFTETKNDDYEFRYSQRDIYENMFRQGYGRDIFNELNREFNRQGFRSGKSFFEAILFGGAAGGLGRILAFMPGPIGKLGLGLRIIQAVGTSLYTLSKMRKGMSKTPSVDGKSKSAPSLKKSLRRFFGKSGGPASENLDINFNITILEADAIAGAKKRLTYSIGVKQEHLLVSIPPGTISGGKLRIKAKGRIKNNHRGDLILTINHKHA